MDQSQVYAGKSFFVLNKFGWSQTNKEDENIQTHTDTSCFLVIMLISRFVVPKNTPIELLRNLKLTQKHFKFREMKTVKAVCNTKF